MDTNYFPPTIATYCNTRMMNTIIINFHLPAGVLMATPPPWSNGTTEVLAPVAMTTALVPLGPATLKPLPDDVNVGGVAMWEELGVELLVLERSIDSGSS